MQKKIAVSARDFADWLLAHGKTSVTTIQASKLLSVPVEQVPVRLNRQVVTNRLFSPSRGLWIPIPPEFRTWGVTPALHFVDDLMRHLGRSYYIGWLSAAEIFGAAHQRPQVFQVAVDQHTASRKLKRVELQFTTRSKLNSLPRIQHPTPTGKAWMAIPELTALDLVDEPRLSAGLSNAATVIAELASEPGLNGDTLAELATQFPATASRRLGYLLELTDAKVDLDPIRAHIQASQSLGPFKLSPTGPRRGFHNSIWQLIINTQVDPDL
ncbi:MAG: type IV toxin-antitoxin system AbiEi family antitoxin domain-containing protein [Candidatus Dormibacteraceae bacterium]